MDGLYHTSYPNNINVIVPTSKYIHRHVLVNIAVCKGSLFCKKTSFRRRRHRHPDTLSYLGTIVFGHNRVRAQMCLGTNVSGHKRVWAQTCLSTNVSEHKRVWAQSCGPNHVWAQTWWVSVIFPYLKSRIDKISIKWLDHAPVRKEIFLQELDSKSRGSKIQSKFTSGRYKTDPINSISNNQI